MPILIFLFGLFIYIYAEVSLLVAVGSTIGVLPLILLMIVISAVGLWLVKLRGMMTILQIRSQMSEGKIPTQAVVSSVFLAISGILLFIPGFLSDILAILLLLPITRKMLQTLFFTYFVKNNKFTAFSSRFYTKNSSQRADENTFDAEFERRQDEDKWVK